MTDLHVDVGSFCISSSIHKTKQFPRDFQNVQRSVSPVAKSK